MVQNIRLDWDSCICLTILLAVAVGFFSLYILLKFPSTTLD